ncbi:MAG: small subunit ribosomal protein, partial [Candidatus Thermoplasmatota archaeon]|nr:small subunit ribosomal protein [Candidatus Thermoplasmatota archaeon]
MAEQKEPKPKGQKGKQAEKAERAPPPAPAKKRDENFRYIIRLVNTDVDGNKDVVIGLNSVKGVGIRTAEIIAKMAGIPRKTKMGDLSEEKTTELEKLITDYSEKVPHWMVNRQSDWSSGADMHLVGVDVEMFRRDDVNMMRMIRCYKGIRHETGQKVRGQRTRSNGRTGMTMGVMRKKEGPA